MAKLEVRNGLKNYGLKWRVGSSPIGSICGCIRMEQKSALEADGRLKRLVGSTPIIHTHR